MLLRKDTTSFTKDTTLSKVKKCLAVPFGILVGWGVMVNPATVEPAQAIVVNKQTTIQFSDPNAVDFEYALFDWSYDDSAAMDGVVELEELENWSWSLATDEGVIVPVEEIVSDGESMINTPFVKFQYQVESNTLSEFNTGALFHNLSTDSNTYSYFDYMINLDTWATTDITFGARPIDDRGTGEVLQSTPEPSLMLGFITLGGVLLGSKRKTKG